MKAFALTSPDRPATLVDLPDPRIAAGNIRVRVRAASVNGFDVFQANGYLLAMMEHQFPTIIGRDFAGIVDAVGEGRSDLAVGDEVFGFVSAMPPLHVGTYAELLAGGPEVVLARKPASLSFEVAAALPLVGATALAAVDAVEAGPGTTVLIVGATGGVGSLAVQLAVQRGASVIATAKPGEDDGFVRGLGLSTPSITPPTTSWQPSAHGSPRASTRSSTWSAAATPSRAWPGSCATAATSRRR
jgi:NADPH:quinone reductase-like Zn-dependent oxidoreductase